ncbi:hypothetical protein GCM10010347_08590 [Streptomyces cirratus]|uniref:Uncharacterized protein n=1 Tax=Streptomyces cirratus TaxID=68187 RepID=A0ABQ3EIP4_9ACTN|nr:hypothetical protein GCM10010347_08590 [Streptomyces cirratus]
MGGADSEEGAEAAVRAANGPADWGGVTVPAEGPACEEGLRGAAVGPVASIWAGSCDGAPAGAGGEAIPAEAVRAGAGPGLSAGAGTGTGTGTTAGTSARAGNGVTARSGDAGQAGA